MKVTKAKEVLRRYAAGERDFRSLNLRGEYFKDENLSGADFSQSDIHSTNFSQANLNRTNFTSVTCGLLRSHIVWRIIISLFLTILLGSTLFVCANTIFSILSFDNQFDDWIVLVILTIALSVISYQGIKIISNNLAATKKIFTSTLIAFFAIFGLGVVTMILLITTSKSLSQTEALKLAVTGGLLGIILFSVAIVTSLMLITQSWGIIGILTILLISLVLIFIINGISALLISGAMILSAIYCGYVSTKENNTESLIYNLVTIGTTAPRTNFRNANLTDAIFVRAKLKSVDFREANLTRVDWHKAEILHCVASGETYIKNLSLRQLLITGEGQNQNFDRQDLRGVNLQKANLTNASFIDTDLSQANLQETILLEAKLVQTNLDKADLRNADLTGAYIEDWGITRNTIFEGIKGDYIYQKRPTKYDRDPNRMPPSQQGNFGKNDLYVFITSVLDTLDLYHQQNINAGVAITVLKGLTEDYPVKFELVGIEKRGNSQYVMKLKLFGQASQFLIQQEYYDRYEQSLPLYDPKKLMPNTENAVAEIIKTVERNPRTNIENLQNKGIVITGGEVNITRKIEGDYYEQSGNFGIGHMSGGEIKGNAKVAGILNEADKKT